MTPPVIHKVATATIFLCYLIWGGDMIAMRFALEAFTPLQIVTARVALPTILYLCLINHWRHEKVRREDWKILICLMLCEPCLFFVCVTNAMRFTSASEAGVIMAALPIVIAIGARIFLKEKMPPLAMAGALLTVVAIGAINLFTVENAKAPQPLLGNILMGCALIFTSCYTLSARYLAGRYSALFISAFQAVGASLVFMPFCLMQPMPDSISLAAIGGISYLSFGIGIGVYLGYNWAMHRVKATVAAIAGNLSPITSLVLAWLILGEQLHPAQKICIGIAFFGILLANYARKKAS